MIVTCEHCHTRYLVAAHMLLPEGRRVRCAGCHHEWIQPPTEDEEDTSKSAPDSSLDDLADFDPLPPMDNKFDDKDDFDDLPDIETNKKDSFADILDTIKPEPEERLPVHVAPTPKVRKGGGVMGSMITAIMLFCVVAAGLYHFKGEVVRLWQPSFALYDALHIAEPMAGQGLAIDKVEAAAQTDGSVKVTGRIINLTRSDTVVPKISLVVRGSDGTELTRWSVDAPVSMLHKESDAVFEAGHASLPDAAHDVKVVFE